MAVYGYDYYGKSLYGAEGAVQYSVAPVIATSIAPGHIKITWGPATQNAWTTLRIVRSPFGVPAHGDDGTVLTEIPHDTPHHSYDDMDLPEGRTYYYGLFLGVRAWSSTASYTAGDVASYNGINYVALISGSGDTPGGDPAYWQPASIKDTWIRAGAVAGLSVADHGYALRMYEGIPRPYRLDTSEVTGYENGVTNPDLYKFLTIFGHQLDTLATQTAILGNLYDIVTAPNRAVSGLAHQFGIASEVSDEPMRQRLHASKAANIARTRGTDAGITDLIATVTEWDVAIDGTTNLMLNQDQANWANPKFPEWNKDLTYEGGDIVHHAGAVWTATKSVRSINYADSMTVAQSSGTVTKNPQSPDQIWAPIYWSYKPRLVLSNATNGYVTLNFAVGADGNYDLSMRVAQGTTYGKVTYSVDGVPSGLGTVDQYLPPMGSSSSGVTMNRVMPATLYLGRYTFSAGTHTLKIQIVGKNAAAKDYLAGIDTLNVTGTADPSTGQEPVDGSGWWTKSTAGIDVTNSVWNPVTQGPSTWGLRNLVTGSYPAGLKVVAGIKSVTTSDTDNNAGKIHNQSFGPNTLGVRSVGTPIANAWSSARRYTLDNLVRDGAGTVWRALDSNENVAPGTNRNVWEIADIQGSDPLNMASMVRQWGIPLRNLHQWSPQVQYVAGDQVAYNNFAYTALADSRNKQPDGDAGDNTFWQYSGPAQRNFTASAYTASLSGATGVTARAFIDWYDAQGTPICTVTDGLPWSSGFFQRFDEPLPSLHGTKGYSTGWTGTWDGSDAWTTSGTWAVSNGILSPIVPSSTPYKVWARHSVPWGTPLGDLKFYVTFMSRPRLGAGAEQGIFFRSDSNLSAFWMASRTRLTATSGTTITTVATWPEVPDGGRIFVSHTASLIEVYQYRRPGLAPKKLASVPQASPNGACFGLLERSL
ncbi:carbohydrate-binding protein [Streptomyces goshikiensis]|uniref:carbohydrate-binding protein n=1 Tax=Streptomyces goshikiensis TaxID=1942 RepID=UPI003656DB79